MPAGHIQSLFHYLLQLLVISFPSSIFTALSCKNRSFNRLFHYLVGHGFGLEFEMGFKFKSSLLPFISLLVLGYHVVFYQER